MLSHNVGGLGSASKAADATEWYRQLGVSVVLMQETWGDPGSLAQVAAGVGSWGGPGFHSPGSRHARGCLTLLSHAAKALPRPLPDQPAAVDAAGRWVRVDLTLAGQRVAVVNVYAPAQGGERAGFFAESLRSALPADRGVWVVLGGDFNCVLDVLDQRGGSAAGEGAAVSQGRRAGAAELRALLEDWQLLDVWREQHPAAADITRWDRASGTGARLDRVYVSSAMFHSWQVSCSIVAERPFSDHHAVLLTAAPPVAVPQGPGWRPHFPLWLLDDQQFRTRFSASVRRVMEEPAPGGPAPMMARWQHIKRAAVAEAAKVIRESAAQRGAELGGARRAAQRARQDLVAAATGGARALAAAAYAAAAKQASRVVGKRVHQARAASRALRQFYGDKPTFVFFRQVAAPAPPAVITALRPAAGQPALDLSEAENQRQAMDLAVAHFSGDAPAGLFRERCGAGAAAAQGPLLAALRRRLHPWEAAECEGPQRDGRASEEELARALRGCRRGSGAGPDGLPYEFYAVFWDLLGGPLVAALNEAFDGGGSETLSPLLLGTIILILKGGRAADLLASYRPITLLNADLRIWAKAVANRLQIPLDQLIDSTQTAFIAGRDISDSVHYHRSLLAYLQQRHEPLWYVLSDLANAYDSVDWGWLEAGLRAMGFRDRGHVRWATLLHRGAQSSVVLNGFQSPWFPLRGGLAQGSGASPLYWTIVMEPFVSYVNSLGVLHRVSLPGGAGPAPPMNAFADDAKTALVGEGMDGDQPAALMEGFTLFQVASGVALSVPKTVVYPAVEGEPGAYGRTFSRLRRAQRRQHLLQRRRQQQAAGQQEQPAAGWHEQPAAGWHEQPAAGWHEQPAAGQQQQPAAGQQQQPAVGWNEQLAAGLQEQLAARQQQQPAVGWHEQLAAGQQEQLAAGWQQQPAVGWHEQLAAGQQRQPAAGQPEQQAAGQQQQPAAGQPELQAAGQQEQPAAGWHEQRTAGQQQQPAAGRPEQQAAGQQQQPAARQPEQPAAGPQQPLGGQPPQRPQRHQQQQERQQPGGAAAEPLGKGVFHPTGFRMAAPGEVPRLLGTPFTIDVEAAQAEAFSHLPGAMRAAAAKWGFLKLNQLGRVLVAKQSLASKAVYQLAFVQPSAQQLAAMQEAIRLFVAAPTSPTEGVVRGDCLWPRGAVMALPRQAGGLAYPLLEHAAAALRAKLVARLFGAGLQPWKPLVAHSLAGAAGADAVPAWPVTLGVADPELGRALCAGLPEYLRPHVAAFMQLQPTRCAASGAQSFYSVMAEPVLLNAAIQAGGRCLRRADLGAAGAAWLRLGDVREGLMGGEAAAVAAAQVVLGAVPAAWRARLEEADPPAPEWLCRTVAEGTAGLPFTAYAVRGPAPPPGAQPAAWAEVLYCRLPTGRLALACPPEALQSGDAVVAQAAGACLAAMRAALGAQPAAWVPAAVVSLPKPSGRWTDADHAALEEHLAQQGQGGGLVQLDAAAAQAPEGWAPPAELWLLGPWASAWVDPGVWEVGGEPLLQFSVKAATAAAGRAKAARSLGDAYAGGAFWPPLWPRPAQPGRGGDGGLEAMEARWQQLFEERPRGVGAAGAGPRLGEGEWQAMGGEFLARDAPWLRAGPAPPAASQARESRLLARRAQADQAGPGGRAGAAAGAAVAAAVAAPLAHAAEPAAVGMAPAAEGGDGNAPPAPAPPATAAGALWRRLHGGQAGRREDRLVCFRVVHGCLAVHAFRLRIMPHLPRREGCCRDPACSALEGCLETLTHAFLACPAAAPVVAWACTWWEYLTPQSPPPPRCAQLLLADNWAGVGWRPEAGSAALWGRLRVALLGCLWEARCAMQATPDEAPPLQERVYSTALALQERLREAAELDFQRVGGRLDRLSPDYPSHWFRGGPRQLSSEEFVAEWGMGGRFCSVEEGRLTVHLQPGAPVPIPGLPPVGALGPSAA